MEIVKTIWLNHKRKIITFLLGALMAVIYSLTGYKFEVNDVTPETPAVVEAPVVPVTGVIDPAPKAK